MRGYAERMNCRITAEFTEVETGKKNDRPELTKAIAYAKRHKATLVIAKLDRISRRVHFISGLMEEKIDFFAADRRTTSRSSRTSRHPSPKKKPARSAREPRKPWRCSRVKASNWALLRT